MNQPSKETREYLRSIASKGGKKAAANMSAEERKKRAEIASAKAADKRVKTKNSEKQRSTCILSGLGVFFGFGPSSTDTKTKYAA